jgi:hypothetical protein
MSTLRKLERDFIKADLSAVQGLLAQLGEEDVMARFGLESRRDELVQTIAHLEALPAEQMASAALYFGGTPVAGTRGIESDFATNAVAKFQDLVSKVLAHESGGLAQRGVVPNKSASTLHITNVVRGSFGFLLEELKTAPQPDGTTLKEAVDETTRLLQAFGDSEEQYRSVVETIDERVLGTARDFFDLMRQRGATLRLVTEATDRSFGSQAVAKAAERASSTDVEDKEENLRGQLVGVLPSFHQFEFRPVGNREVIHGKISSAIPSYQLEEFSKNLVFVDVTARLRLKRVRRSGAIVRESYTLLELERVGGGLLEDHSHQ